jgi:hypothetical protein
VARRLRGQDIWMRGSVMVERIVATVPSADFLRRKIDAQPLFA